MTGHGLSEADVTGLAEALRALDAYGLHTESAHGCDGTEEVCMVTCPVPVQVQDPPEYLAEAMAPTVARMVAAAEQRVVERALQRVDELIAYLEPSVKPQPDDKGKWIKGYRQACADNIAALRVMRTAIEAREDEG